MLCIDPAARVQRLSVLEVELMWFSYGEERAMANDLRAQNVQTPRRSRVMWTSPGYVRCPAGMHPEHGDAVGFPPGRCFRVGGRGAC